MKEMLHMEGLLRSLPRSLQEYIEKAKQKMDGDEHDINSTMAAYCPNCSGERTMDSYEAPLNDMTVGICLECCTLWCLECEEVFQVGQTVCGHWSICDRCAVEPDGECECPPLDCSFIQSWKQRTRR